MAWAPAIGALATLASSASGLLTAHCPGAGWWAITVALLCTVSFCGGVCVTVTGYYLATRDWPLQLFQALVAARAAGPPRQVVEPAVLVRQRFGGRLHAP